MPFIAISPYSDVNEVTRLAIGAVISVLGRGDGLPWPDVGDRAFLRLGMDDVGYSTGNLEAPTPEGVHRLIKFAQAWNGESNLLVHCRAGTSRSPAAAMIALASVPALNHEVNFRRLFAAKAYYRPNTTMLRLADETLGSNLVQIANSYKASDRADDVGLALVQLEIH